MVEKLRVNDHFLSYQGTGQLCGTLQYFIRLAGCTQRCPLRRVCDEQEALDASNRIDDFDFSKIVNPSKWFHVTGGEPLEQQSALCKMIFFENAAGRYNWHLQTSGLVEIKPGLMNKLAWVTVSPKSTNLLQAIGNEMVLVNDPKWVADDVAKHLMQSTSFDHYFLQPMEDRDGSFNIEDTVAMCKRLGSFWRLTWQMHKALEIK